jgi:hypothetical protein
MNKLMQLISDGHITVEDITNIPVIIERAKLVKAGLEACSKTIVFPLGEAEVFRYDYTDMAGEYHSWGKVANNGYLTIYSNWGGDHRICYVNLLDATEVLVAMDDDEARYDLTRFLTERIDKANGKKEDED